MPEEISLTIDGVEVTVPAGTTLLQAARSLESTFHICVTKRLRPMHCAGCALWRWRLARPGRLLRGAGQPGHGVHTAPSGSSAAAAPF